ncbi:MAG: hypothetical protein RJA61_545 [Candidatus Parcubacteria bacterium]|jgi:hypothetical protein
MFGIVVNMKFTTRIQDDTVYLSIGSIITEEDVNEFTIWVETTKGTIHSLYEKLRQPIPVLVDVSNLKEYKPEAFGLLAALLRHDEPYTSKIALIGANPFIFAAKDALTAYSGVATPLESFKTSEEALVWLRS